MEKIDKIGRPRTNFPVVPPWPPPVSSRTRGTIMFYLQGFDSLSAAEGELGDKAPPLRWYWGPDDKKVNKGECENANTPPSSWWSLVLADRKDGTSEHHLLLSPPGNKDFWRKTFYKPLLVKDNGLSLYASLPKTPSNTYTVETKFTLEAYNQFDQAGIYVRMDHNTWIKAGIEVVDGQARLSCVVTNSYSDWSTVAYPSATLDSAVCVDAHIRLHCIESSFVLEFRPPSTEGLSSSAEKWEFVRISHLRCQDGATTSDPLDCHPAVQAAWQGPGIDEDTYLWAGVFSCCPVASGAKSTFTKLEIREGSNFDHAAD